MPRSRWGWTLASVYLAVALSGLLLAGVCRDGFFCGIYAIPMLVPAGFVYLMLFGGSLPGPAALQWPLVLATLLTNTALYYLAGVGLAAFFRRRT